MAFFERHVRVRKHWLTEKSMWPGTELDVVDLSAEGLPPKEPPAGLKRARPAETGR